MTIFIGLLSLFWMLIVFVGYGYTNKPFLPEELVGGLLVIWRTFTAIIILSLAGGIGMSTGIQKQGYSPLVQAVLAGALGMGIISISMLIIATTIGINFTLWIFLITTILIFRKGILLWWKAFQDIKNFWQDTGKAGRVAILLMMTILASQYLVALAPPLQFDALTYHLSIPKAYLQAGHIIYLQNNIFWGMPQLVEILYTLAIYMGGTEAAPVLGWWIGLLALIGLVGFTKNIFEQEEIAWVAAASIMAGSGLTISFSSGYVEWASILYGLCILIYLSHWLVDERISRLVMAGILAGMAFGVKYTNGIILIGGAVVILFSQKFSSLKKSLTNLLWFGGMAVLTMLPWLIKNITAASNPFYPVFIPSGAMDAILLAFYQFKPSTQDWSRIVLLPWLATIWGVDGADGFSASIGPLLLGLSPFALIYWHKLEPNQKTAVKAGLGILLVGFLAWAIGSQFRGLLIQTRLYFIIFPSWALLAAAGYVAIVKINSYNIRFGKLADTFILLALLFNTLSTIKAISASNPTAVILNLESRESYLSRQLGGYETAMQALQSLEGNPQVLMLWETRSFECQPNCDPDEIIGRWYHDWSIYQNSNSIISAWKEQGYTHLLLNRNGAEFVRKYDVNAPSSDYWRGLQLTIEKLNPVEENMGGYELYQLP
jgi:4-amino-4-deoxy-L-arabinose transferase-like glycosyltransferase